MKFILYTLGVFLFYLFPLIIQAELHVGIGKANLTSPIGTPSAGYVERKGEGMQGIQIRSKKERLLLVTGCGRSGTSYMAAFLNASGLKVGHERSMEKDGCVSWLMAAEGDWAPWGPLSKDYEFQHIFHVVRDPINVIQSFYNSPPLATWEWISYIIPEIQLSDPALTKCAKYWYYWNLMAEARAEWTYRIEDFDMAYKEMEEKLGLSFSGDAIKSIPKNANTRQPVKREISWTILQDELDPDLYAKVLELALRYGYQQK